MTFHAHTTTKGKPEVKVFIIFADATTNKTTYGGGRYLYSCGPVKDGKVRFEPVRVERLGQKRVELEDERNEKKVR